MREVRSARPGRSWVGQATRPPRWETVISRATSRPHYPEPINQPARNTRRPATTTDVFAEFLPKELRQPVAMAVLLHRHLVEERG